MTAAGADFSLAGLLAPLPVEFAGQVLDIIRCVPASLAGPVLQQCSFKQHGLDLAGKVAENVIWKISHYLPSVSFQGHRRSLGLPAMLKDFRELCPDLPLVEVGESLSQCHLCADAPMQPRRAMCKATISSNLPDTIGTHVTDVPFKVYSLTAGVQHSVVSKHCSGPWEHAPSVMDVPVLIVF